MVCLGYEFGWFGNRLRRAQFRTTKTIEQFDFARLPHLNRALVHDLATGRYRGGEIWFNFAEYMGKITVKLNFHLIYSQTKTTVEIGKTIIKGSTDGIHIMVVEGPSNRHSSTNKPIGTLSITGEQITRDLIRGTEVDLTIEMSESRDLTISAFLNGTNQEFSQVFNSKQREVSSQVLASEILMLETKLQSEIDDANETGSRETVDGLTKVLTGVQDLIGSAADLASDDVTDKKFQLEDKKRKLAQSMFELTSGKRAEQARLKYEEIKANVQAIIRESGNDRERHAVSEIIAREQSFLNSTSAEKINEIAGELDSIRFHILHRTPAFLKGVFKYLNENRASMNDQIQATQLIENGKRAVEREDFDGLNRINGRLWDLMPAKEKDTEEYRAFTGIV